MMCLLHRIGDGDRLLEVTGVQLSRSSGSTGSLLLASLPSSFSGSFSDSAELDSSSDSSLFPNQALSGFGERCEERTVVVGFCGIHGFFWKEISLRPQKLPTFLPTSSILLPHITSIYLTFLTNIDIKDYLLLMDGL